MELNGREVKFMYNILASIEIAKLCPDGRLENIEKLFGEETYETDISNTNKFMIALNRGYIAAKKAVEPDYDVKELSEDELMLISNAEYLELQNEAFKAYKEGNERHVHTAPVKSKGKKTGTAAKKSS